MNCILWLDALPTITWNSFKNVHCELTLGISGCTIWVCCHWETLSETKVAMRLFKSQKREFAHASRPSSNPSLQAVQKLLLLSHNTVNILWQSNTEHSYDNIQEMFLLLFLFNWQDIPPIICIEIWLWWEGRKLGKVYSLALENYLILWNSKRFSGDESWKGASHCIEAPP